MASLSAFVYRRCKFLNATRGCALMNYFAIPRCFASARHAAERSGTISAPLKFTGIESKRRKSGREPFPTGESFALQVVVSASSIACMQKTAFSFFREVFLSMFVPSLSWQMIVLKH
eukprot:COSAG06_NODE_7375_length_2524_cov_1.708041_3_plen_117_part_00